MGITRQVPMGPSVNQRLSTIISDNQRLNNQRNRQIMKLN